MTGSPTDFRLMNEAVTLAKKARPNPNPRVGAVIVKDGEVIAQGYHEKPGGPHAEIVALRNATKSVIGADLYVTLEPCIHTGRTGPCVEAIIQASISRVFVGMTDPDKRVNGRGIAALRAAGIQVTTGISEPACRDLLSGYITHRTSARPRVILKAAVTLDGCIATTSGDSKWISCAQSRQAAHQLRAESDAVLIGVQTVLADNPLLTVRDAPGQSPLRIVMDSTLRTPSDCNLIQENTESGVLLVYTNAARAAIERLNTFSHVECLQCAATADGKVQIEDLLFKLGERGVFSLLVEGGQKVIGGFLQAKTADELVLFIAPKILGGGTGWTNFPHAQIVADAIQVQPTDITRIGDDLLYRANITYPVKSP